MRIILTILAIVGIMVPAILFGQNNPRATQASTETSSANAKKVYYVEKRTKPVQNYSKDKSKTQKHKKPLIRKAENPKRVLSK